MKLHPSLLLFSILLLSCGRDEIVAPRPPVSVSISPSNVTIYVDSSLQMKATIANRTDQSVVWSVLPKGAADVGRITASGLYTAPHEVPESGIAVTIKAVATNDTASGLAQVVVRPPTQRALQRPGVGSRYTFAFEEFDTNGAKVPGSDTTVIYEVTSAGITDNGRDGVIVTEPSFGGYSKWRMLDDGSVEVWSALGRRWLRIPFAGGLPDTVVISDTVRADGTRLSQTVVASFVSSTERTILGKRYLEHTAKITYEERRTGNDFYSIGDECLLSFVPSLGWFSVLRRTAFYDDTQDHWRFGRRGALIAFERK